MRPSVQKRAQHVRRPVREHASTARQERVWLEVVRDAPPLDLERILGRRVGRHDVAFEHDDRMPRPRQRERRCKPGNTATGDDESHLRKLSRLGRVSKQTCSDLGATAADARRHTRPALPTSDAATPHRALTGRS
jgi:hypothetical protein